MKVLNEGFLSKAARLNAVLRRLRELGVNVSAVDYSRDGGRLRLPSAPPNGIVPRAIHKVRGVNLAKFEGVTLMWEGQP